MVRGTATAASRSLPTRRATEPARAGGAISGVIRSLAAAAAGIVLLSACSAGPRASGPGGSEEPSGPGSASGSSAGTGSASTAPSGTGTPSAPASAAGNLSRRNVPSALGPFTPSVPSPDDGEEGGFASNGTPVRALDARYAATEALPPCSQQEVKVPRATHGITANYSYEGRPGALIVLDFAGPADARAWFSAFTGLVRSCPRVGTAPTITATTVTDQRENAGSVWTEAGRVDGARATMGSVQSKDVDPARLLEDVRSAR